MKLRVAVPERLKRLAPAGAGSPANAPFAQQLAARGPQLATIVLAGAIAAQLALLAWKFLPNQAPPPLPLPGVAQTAGAAFDPSAIVNAHLFGTAAPAAGSAEAAPVTRVALVLVGTIAATDPQKGLAILGESPQAARVYSVGQQVPGGVKLHSVFPDRVVLDRGGALETLPLPRQVAAGSGIVNPASAPAPAPSGDGTEPPIGESVQRLIAQGPEVVGEMLRPMPAFANGQLQGFRLYPGRNRQKFAKLGLQPGDLVTQVNGVPLGDAQRGMELLRGLGNAGTAQVTIERGGSVQQITINASQIASMTAPGETSADE